MRKYYGLELLEKLCLEFGPSGCEDSVAALITAQIDDSCDAYFKDRNGNLTAKVCGRGLYYNKQNPKKLMLSAHMDEVGFMVNEITDEGYLKFDTVGGIIARVLAGRNVVISTDSGKVKGIIAAKAIHLQSPTEKTSVIPTSEMYIDIGATSREEAEKYIQIGDEGVFDSDFVRFGKDGCKIKSKAIDNRIGCALLIEIMRTIYASNKDIAYDVYFTFTCGEEVAISGAQIMAQTIAPDVAVVFESTAVSDIAGNSDATNVAIQGEGGVVTFMDKGTIYDRGLVDSILTYAENSGIKAQLKRYVAGGNDAAHIHKSGKGVKTVAISAPTRYIHSQSCVVDVADYESMKALGVGLILDMRL